MARNPIEFDLAVLVLESRDALFNRRVAPLAELFYTEVAGLLHRNGFRVVLTLEHRTSLQPRAATWIVHGADLTTGKELAPGRMTKQLHTLGRIGSTDPNVRVMTLETLSGELRFTSWQDRASAPAHYVLSENDRKLLNSLQPLNPHKRRAKRATAE
jgi:hypothetical protein